MFQKEVSPKAFSYNERCQLDRLELCRIYVELRRKRFDAILALKIIRKNILTLKVYFRVMLTNVKADHFVVRRFFRTVNEAIFRFKIEK